MNYSTKKRKLKKKLSFSTVVGYIFSSVFIFPSFIFFSFWAQYLATAMGQMGQAFLSVHQTKSTENYSKSATFFRFVYVHNGIKITWQSGQVTSPTENFPLHITSFHYIVIEKKICVMRMVKERISPEFNRKHSNTELACGDLPWIYCVTVAAF